MLRRSCTVNKPLNEEVSGTNQDEVSRLPTPTPQFRSTPLPQKTNINWHPNFVPFCREILIIQKTTNRNTQNILCISPLTIVVSGTKR
jgi:hypothetical protein